MIKKAFPKAMKHGDIEEVFSDVFFVTGSCSSRRPLPMKFSRNMTVVRDGNELTLINTVRLNEAGLKQLEALGQVKHVIRLAGFHGVDDPFYKDRYGAKVWSVDAVYNFTFDAEPKPAELERNGSVLQLHCQEDDDKRRFYQSAQCGSCLAQVCQTR